MRKIIALWRKIKDRIDIYKQFILRKNPHVSSFQRLSLLLRFFYIHMRVDCKHSNFEIVQIAQSILERPNVDGSIVEAGTYKGGASAKLSLVAKLTGRRLLLFDSFQGLPENDEFYNIYEKRTYSYDPTVKKTKYGYVFSKGQYSSSLQELKKTIRLYGAPEVCVYHKGWFEKTMKNIDMPIAALFLDVDLASSTKTCLKYLYPLLEKGGVLYSHDGHLGRVTDVYKDKSFWKKEVGSVRPIIHGLGRARLLKIVKQQPSFKRV